MFLYPLKTRASGFLVFLGGIKKDQCNEMVSEFLEFLFYLKLFDNLFKLENWCFYSHSKQKLRCSEKKIVKKKLIDDKNIHADDKDEGKLTQSIRIVTTWKVSKYGVFSGPYFLAFGLNTEIYGINLRIQSECEKILNRKTSVFRHFLRSVYCDRIDPLDTGCKLNIHIT